MAVIGREAWEEFRFGLRSGVVALILVGLTAYLLMVLTHAGYLREMGAADVPRNAPSLIYLMTSGDAFFLLFAWAWVFAQPVTRDRSAQLHELILTAPVSLRSLLVGRFLGATGVALLLGASQLLGFLLAPVLEWVGAVPQGSVAATPWAAMGWASLVIALPSALGCGAVYMLLALRTRSLVGPFAGASVLMMFWMFAMIVLKEAHIDPFWSTVLDPSLFAESETQVLNWTPVEKSTALLELTPRLWVNRLIWCVLPLLVFAVALWRVHREQLVLERPPRNIAKSARKPVAGVAHAARQSFHAASSWLSAAMSEAAWQCGRTLNRRGVWVAFTLLVVIGTGSGFVHGVGHAEGPMVPRPEFIAPQLMKSMYLLVAFVVAAAAGLVARRDHVAGFDEMLDATAAPEWVRMAGRATAVLTMAALFSLAPGLSGLAVSLLAAPSNASPASAIVYQVLVMLPAMLEMAAMMVLIHALVRPAGPAYAASLLVAFVFIVNHEADLVSYPPAEIAIPVHLMLSGLTGWAPWLDRVAAGDAWKVALAVLFVSLGFLAGPRGTEGGWRAAVRLAARRVAGPIGVTVVVSVVTLAVLGTVQQEQLVDQGGYRSSDGEMADNAAWEQRWAPRAGPFSVAGGDLALNFDPAQQEARGTWKLFGVKAPGGWLHAELPRGLEVQEVTVDGKPVQVEVSHDHVGIPLGSCAGNGCALTLSWRVSARGWNAEGQPGWMQPQGLWARAVDVAPRLGMDRDRVVHARSDRLAHGLVKPAPEFASGSHVAAAGIAPSGEWRWTLTRVPASAAERPLESLAGSSKGPLDFMAMWLPTAQRSSHMAYTVFHDPSRSIAAASVAADVDAMSACIARRLGRSPALSSAVQLPRGMDTLEVVEDRLLLPESPSWDITDEGTGRWLRRAHIAAALARAEMIRMADLRAAEGTPLLTEALAGSLGLVCVADSDGIPALQALLARGADATTQSLAASKVPVGRADQALASGWLKDYGPLAFLARTTALTPADYTSLLSASREGGARNAGALAVLGERLAALPNAADLGIRRLDSRFELASERWTWQSGGWSSQAQGPEPVVLELDASGHLAATSWSPAKATAQGSSFVVLVPDAYERSPMDNGSKAARR